MQPPVRKKLLLVALVGLIVAGAFIFRLATDQRQTSPLQQAAMGELDRTPAPGTVKPMRPDNIPDGVDPADAGLDRPQGREAPGSGTPPRADQLARTDTAPAARP